MNEVVGKSINIILGITTYGNWYHMHVRVKIHQRA